jgi:hypothetical protein
MVLSVPLCLPAHVPKRQAGRFCVLCGTGYGVKRMLSM